MRSTLSRAAQGRMENRRHGLMEKRRHRLIGNIGPASQPANLRLQAWLAGPQAWLAGPQAWLAGPQA